MLSHDFHLGQFTKSGEDTVTVIQCIVVILDWYESSGESLKPAEDWKRPVNVARALPAAAAATAFTPLFQLRSDATAMRCCGIMSKDGDTNLCVQG